MAEKVLVSACFLGRRCRFDGKNSLDVELIRCLKGYHIIGVCPEELGGVRKLRGPFEIKGKTSNVFKSKAGVYSIYGRDVTKKFVKGAYKVLNIAEKKKIKFAILRSKSPSCSPNFIYNGNFRNILKKEIGITAYLLKDKGIEVISNEEFNKRYKFSL